MTDDRFDLNVFRDTADRIKMILDPDCPLAVHRVVAEFDEDQDVLVELYLLDLGDEFIDAQLSQRITLSEQQLEYRRNRHLYGDRDRVFCAIPWNHASTNADGSIRMCCQMIYNDSVAPYGSVFKEDGTVLRAEDDLSANRNAPAWKQVRADMLAGRDPEICKLCAHEEANGIGSKREWTREHYPDAFLKAMHNTAQDGTIDDEVFPLEYYDLRFGNKCNLKCRSCGPTDSDLWYEDWYKEHDDHSFPYRGHDTLTIERDDKGTYSVPGVFDWHANNDTALWTKIYNDIENIDRFYFTGGEPTINLKHRELLQVCIDKGVANGISLDYNTNMAGVPSRVFEQWKQFKRVGIGMSLDGMYEHFEYIRHPGKWSVVEKNIRRIENEPGFDNLSASITLTLSTMNVLHVLDMIWWMREQQWTRINEAMVIHNLYGPEYFNIQNLPEGAKYYVNQRYEQFVAAMNRRWSQTQEQVATGYIIEKRLRAVLDHMWAVEQDEAAWAKWFTETARYDVHRGEDWKETFPELVEMLQVANDRKARKQKVKLTTAGKR